MGKIRVSNLLSFVLIIGVSIYGYMRFAELPESVPTHFDLSGHPNGYSSRWFLMLFIPLLSLALQLLMPLFLKISPQGFKMEQSRDQLPIINLTIAGMMSCLQLGMLSAATHGNAEPFPFYFGLAMSIILVGLGNVMGKIEPNFLIGIRLPWTLTSDQNWLATHRFAGRSMVISGVILLISNFIFASVPIAVGLLFVGTLSPVIYSYLFFRRHSH